MGFFLFVSSSARLYSLCRPDDGMNAHIVKPYDPEALIRLLARHLK